MYCREHADRLRNLNGDTYDLICALLNLKSLMISGKNYYNNETEDVNMCKAIEDWAKEEQEKGKKEGEKRLGALIERLHQDNRTDDILKAAKSVRTRYRLYQEYKL